MIQVTLEQIQRLKADVGLAVTVGTIPTAWLSNIDFGLKMLLTVVGIVSGGYAALYYRALYRKLKDQQ